MHFELAAFLLRFLPRRRAQSGRQTLLDGRNVFQRAIVGALRSLGCDIGRGDDVDLVPQVIKASRRSKNISTQSGTGTSSLACSPIDSRRRTTS